MTDGGAVIEPDAGESPAPFWPRSAYAGFKAFGGGDGAVLLTPDAVRDLRSAAELAAREERTGGGLLFGRGYTDGQGGYLVVDSFLEAGPGEAGGRSRTAAGPDEYTLPEDDLRLLRADAARMYPASREAGWWRTLPEPGDFGPGDFLTQQELVEPGGAGLLVYGSGRPWGSAYLGPDGRTPDVSGTLVVVPETEEDPGPEPAGSAGDPGPADPGPQVIDLAAGDSLLSDPRPADDADDTALVEAGLVDDGAAPPPDSTRAETVPGTALAPRRPGVLVPRPTTAREMSPVRVSSSEWTSRPPGGPSEPGMPADVKIVVALLLIVPVIAAVMIGMLVGSALIALVVAVVCVLLVLGFVWMTRL
jgi:hypothetical protein